LPGLATSCLGWQQVAWAGNKLPGPPVIWAVGLKRQLTEEKLGSIKQYLSGIEKEINQRFN
jgi:hypothetical protein